MFNFLRAGKQAKGPQSIYDQLGGEPSVRAMAERFYDVMESDPRAKDLLAIHPQPMTAIRQKFFEFLSGWFGGPQLFEEKYGHPRLRARHMPFTIDVKLRDQWLFCMYQVLDEQIEDELLKMQLRQRFTQLAHHMINTD
ncbi:group II truncated hemoglobin [Pseudidiomarina andamanensis]|uniref:Hemoglobin-like oxygen-binding protein n=1 Tax=Pseudidiomarina andamanensis TaxID=1940690 RepID=A0AA92ETL8_9GAMM|nr:group II truncated hemoglobin [Pseudidiomarina andamanensis]MDS0218962.1 group II truncated hemoglobin [Pseudidiomarina andamanensis]QGT96322.1 hemoglobin-like oxygen-binding protein [Pseudidiomarina andamanensis]